MNQLFEIINAKGDTTVATGKTEACATITIKVGKTIIGSGKSNKLGDFKVTIKVQKKYAVLNTTATDAAKNVSGVMTVKVQ